ncbi:hypothetical protein ICW40_09430 [Actinotalea ferrariae]|uniref:DUF6910 family protein n=1 Tax=Actinotalea ferrariae TaxID=1386098 RepID=UPI001C8BCB14|nr:hypothetical protein [Actinotalea ferrariae]MBX9245029.1 hypothetical protein [Actinotalea ferrariae]
MEIEVEDVTALSFADGTPVRAASAVVRFDGGMLIAQDDATSAAWWRDGVVRRVRVLPAVEGLDTFDEASGTKHLKPDLEAAFEVPPGAAPEHTAPGDAASASAVPRDDVVLLGSGSSPARTRAVLLGATEGEPTAAVADLAPLYASVARALDVAPDLLNLEGACVVDGVVRWFHRGLPSAGVPTASVDVDLALLLEAIVGRRAPHEVPVRGARRYDLGSVDGVGLAVTDAVRLDGVRLLVSTAAEDTRDPRDDGPVVASALAVLEGDVVTHTAALPHVEGRVPKVEGLAVVGSDDDHVRLLATIDSDDAAAASLAVTLRVRW